jgi:hypothetical protein
LSTYKKYTGWLKCVWQNAHITVLHRALTQYAHIRKIPPVRTLHETRPVSYPLLPFSARIPLCSVRLLGQQRTV